MELFTRLSSRPTVNTNSIPVKSTSTTGESFGHPTLDVKIHSVLFQVDVMVVGKLEHYSEYVKNKSKLGKVLQGKLKQARGRI